MSLCNRFNMMRPWCLCCKRKVRVVHGCAAPLRLSGASHLGFSFAAPVGSSGIEPFGSSGAAPVGSSVAAHL